MSKPRLEKQPNRARRLIEAPNPAFAVGRSCGWIEGEHDVMCQFVRHRHECCRAAQTDRSVDSERCAHATLDLVDLLLSVTLHEQPSRLLGRTGVWRPASMKLQSRRLDAKRGAHREDKVGNVCICYRERVELLEQKRIV